MQKKFIVILFFLSFFSYAQKEYSLNKISSDKIKLDGVVNKSEWADAIQIPLIYEQEPGKNIKAERNTIAYLTHSDEFLFVAFVSFIDPDTEVRASIRPRDNMSIWNDDMFIIRFDTFKDARNNFVFSSNSLGSQFDLRMLNATDDRGKYDSSFNANFISNGSIAEDRYQVEWKIPFSEIPSPNGENQQWNFNLGNRYYKDGKTIELGSQAYDRDNPCEVCQTTDILNISNIKVKKRFELLPYVSASVSGERENIDDKISYDPIERRVGLGINMDFNKTTSLEVTFNPDFSQVEADVTRIDINSAVSLRYRERRPYFSRGTDIVRFSDGAFYSRSISNPSISTKLLSQNSNSRIFFLTAVDQDSPYLVASEDKSYLGQGGQSFVNVFRYQRIINDKARIGMYTSNRYYEGGGYGNLVGIDGLLILNKKWRLNYELFKNFNQEPTKDWIDSSDKIGDRSVILDGQEFNGDAMYLTFERNTEHWKSYFTYRNISPDYQTDVGFVVKNNRRWGTLRHTYQNIVDKENLRSYEFGTKLDVNYTFDNNLKTISLDGDFQIETIGNTEISYTYDWDIFKNFMGIDFKDLPTSDLNIRSSPTEFFNFNISYEWGKDLAYNEEVPEKGKLKTFSIYASFQINENLNINGLLNYSELKQLETSEYYFSGNIFRLTTRYQFSNFLNLRLIAEKNTFNKSFFIQPLVQWNPNPSTIFYLGGNQNTDLEIDEEIIPLLKFRRSQIFFKFQYLIGLKK